MTRWLKIQTEPIDEPALIAARRISAGAGAVICFLGVVRGREGPEAISALEYETFREMAEHQFHKLLDQASVRWPVEGVRLVHRVGTVRVNEPSLWIEVTAPHRAEAFAACQFIIDEMKRVVPIWKKAVA